MSDCCCTAAPVIQVGQPGCDPVLVGVADASCPPTSDERSVDIDVVQDPACTFTVGARLSPCFGEDFLAAAVELTPVPAGQWTATDLTVTLPEAGTYDLLGELFGALNIIGPAGGGAAIHARLFNVTGGAAVVNSERRIIGNAVGSAGESTSNQATSVLGATLTVAAPTTFRIEVVKLIANGTVTTFSGITPPSRLSYRKLAD